MKDFFAYATKRYLAFLTKQRGDTFPYTDDPIIQQFRFCNVFREDDKTTVWIRKNLREPLSFSRFIIPVMVAARFINRIEVLEDIKHTLLLKGWDSHIMVSHLTNLRRRRIAMITGAYMVRTPFGMTKPRGLDVIMRPIQRATHPRHFDTLQSCWEYISQFPYLGGFMAYEVVSDLRYTNLCAGVTDADTWAHAGPGATRGMSRVMGVKFTQGNQQPLLEGMRLILKESRNPDYWNPEWPAWDMRTVEHTLCEFDKYERFRLGQGRPKQKYNGV